MSTATLTPTPTAQHLPHRPHRTRRRMARAEDAARDITGNLRALGYSAPECDAAIDLMDRHPGTAPTLLGLAVDLHAAGLYPREVLGWLTVAAAAPDGDTLTSLQALLTPAAVAPSDNPRASYEVLGSGTPLHTWRAMVPGTIAPWAWAAGLTPHGARDAWEALSTSRPALQAAAVARGFRLPPQ